MKKGKKKVLNTIGEDGCCCGEYDDGKTYIKAHCWRTTINGKIGGCECNFAGVHYRGSKKTAEQVAGKIADDYMCDVSVVRLTPTQPKKKL